MAKQLKDWIESDVKPYQNKSLRWLSQYHFFRDPCRSSFVDPSTFFAPADGIILYAKSVWPQEPVVDIKSQNYCLQEALQDSSFDKPCIVVGIFMTFFDVHVNRVPYSGRLSYNKLDPIDTYNYPMLEVEQSLLEQMRLPSRHGEYLLYNERMVNRIYSPRLQLNYYVLQIADFDVDSILPFELEQNEPVSQGDRFSQIRYGSQVDLILPIAENLDYTIVCEPGYHVEAGVDALVTVRPR